ncbi:MAG TPA: hypothetical protein ENK91_16785, partial [Bacteroidetes bacterium]|nr:hypothetical protein [Bacteroidota bacterium]
PGIEIKLLDKDSTIIKSIVSFESDSHEGSYLFSDLEPGKYFIKAILPEKFSFVDVINVDESINSDINPETGLSNPIILEPGENNIDIDIGLKYSFGEIESFVWLDRDYNGIQDSNEVAISGIEMILQDADSTLEISRNKSDSSGLVLFENVLPGKYRLLVDSLDRKYKITYFENSMDKSLDCDFKAEGDKISSSIFEIYPGEINKDIDLGMTYNFGTLSGFVWNDKDSNGIYDTGEELLEDIEIEIYDINESTGNPVSSTFSGVNGNYEFTGLKSSVYFIKFNGNSRYKLGPGEGIDNYISNQNGLGTTDSIFIDWGQDIDNVNGALISNKCIVGDLVWLDDNGNGLKDSLELGVDGVHVDLYNTQDSLIQSTVSGEGGEYYMDGIEAGNYYLKFTCDSIYKFTIPKLNEDNGSKVIGAGFIGKTNGFLLEPGSQNLDLDAGLLVNFSSIGDFVWLDTNKNGTVDGEEKGLDSIKLELVNMQSNLTRTVFSDENGYYHFDSLEAGNYYLKLPDINDTLDFANNIGSKTDFTGMNGTNTTSTFYINPGTEYDDFDIGLVLKTATIGDRVWLDANENGIQDTNENGLNNIQVILFDINGIEYDRTTTSKIEGQDGQYHFEVDPGYYFIRFILPFEYNSTIGKQGSEDLDSD